MVCVFIYILTPSPPAVHVVLVTDMVVLLTERDQRYHLVPLLDHKVRAYNIHTVILSGYMDYVHIPSLQPPVIRLFDLHVRVNASVKAGVQLLLVEKGNSPEMFRLEFSSKKLARE